MRYYLTIIVGMVVLAAFYVFWNNANSNSFQIDRNEVGFPVNFEIGTWMWESVDDLNQEEIENLLKNANAAGVNIIYLGLYRIIEISDIQDIDDRVEAMDKFSGSLAYFVDIAREYGISIHGLAGNPNWVFSDRRYLNFNIVDFISEYNRSHINGFSGVHFDLEFYNNLGYAADDENINSLYLTLVQEIVDYTPDNLDLGFDTAFWLDEGVDPVTFRTLDILNKRPGSQLVIMAYRNYSNGRGGANELSEDEVAYGTENTPNVSIVIGQETTINGDPKLTYYGEELVYFKNEVLKIADYYKNYSNVGGIAINDLTGFLKLN